MDMGDDSDGGDGVDAELEAELNNLMFGGSKANKPRKTKGNFKDIQLRKHFYLRLERAPEFSLFVSGFIIIAK